MKRNSVEDADDRLRLALRERWRNDYPLYCKERLGIIVWAAQIDIANRISANMLVAVASGQKTGKSIGAATLGLWWCETRDNAPVMLTSTSDQQVRKILWMEVRKAIMLRAPTPRSMAPGSPRFRPELADIPDWVIDASYKFAWDEPPLQPSTGLQSPLTGNEIYGRVSATEEGAAGFSGANFLIIGDEASGIPEFVFGPLLGNLAGGGRILLLSNPTQTTGVFFDAFNSKKDAWDTKYISSWDTPNVVADDNSLIPGLATRTWCEKMRDLWGAESARYQVRVLGKFPTESPEQVIGFGMIEKALARWDMPEEETGSGLSIGVDVARFGGDSSVVYATRNNRAWHLDSVGGMDNVAVANMVLNCVNTTAIPGEMVAINIDGTGIGGGVVDILRDAVSMNRFDNDVTIRDINFGRKAVSEQACMMRDELWWGAREMLSSTIALEPGNVILEKDLLAPRYKPNKDSKVRVEPKDSIKKRIGRSPDEAEAFLLSIWGRDSIFDASLVDALQPDVDAWGAASGWG